MRTRSRRKRNRNHAEEADLKYEDVSQGNHEEEADRKYKEVSQESCRGRGQEVREGESVILQSRQTEYFIRGSKPGNMQRMGTGSKRRLI